MATMFGVDATTLSGPQGAGSQPLSPVQERAVDPGYSGAINVAGGVAASAAAFFHEQETKKKVPEWMGVRNQFQAELARLSEAANQATDRVTRNRLITQGRTLYNQYMAEGAAYGEEYSKAINNAYTYNKTGSGWDEIEDVRKKEVEAEDKLLQPLAAMGVIAQPGDMTPEQRQTSIALAQNWNKVKYDNEQLLAAQDRQMKMAAEGRAEQNHAFTTHQQTMTLQAQSNLSTLLSASVDNATANFDAVKQKMDAGTLDFTAGWFSIEQMIGAQRQQAAIALQGDPATLSTYNQQMDSLMKAGKTYLDPATRTQASKDEFERLLNLQKLAIARKPGGIMSIALSDLYGKDVTTQLNNSRLLSTLVDDIDAAYRTRTIPSVLSGDGAAQANTFKSVQEQVTKAVNGQLPASNQVIEQAAEFTNSVLNTVGNINPSDPKSLAYVNDYLASETMATLIKEGKISPDMAAKAREPFLEGYAKGLAKQMGSFLTSSIGEATYTDGQRDATKTPTRVQLLRFEPSADGTMKVVESRDQNFTFTMSPYHAASLRNDASKQAAELSKTVRSYAHIQGHTNYEQAWNEIRHVLVPGQFPTPDRVKDAMADGWDGVGFFNNATSWKRKDGTTE